MEEQSPQENKEQSQPDQPQPQPQPQKHTLITILIAIIAALIAGIAVYIALMYSENTAMEETEEVSEETTEEAEDETAPEITAPPFEEETEEEETEEETQIDWNTYTNEAYNYTIQYPAGAEISEAEKSDFGLSQEMKEEGFTIDKLYQTYTGELCVTIGYDLGYVMISAPPNNEEFIVRCGRSGIAYETEEKEETLTIDGKTYTATGFEELGPGDTLDSHNETMIVQLDDGTRIEYGSKSSNTATFDDYLEIRNTIVSIVESFESV
ncbi:hypothetical protein GF366_01675 [Candidatus Peregrinibacteria bacterium]|nr:hypothetical protein [Candidatus Peregrinibacteria bacterium]